jgi:hypothetical protein
MDAPTITPPPNLPKTDFCLRFADEAEAIATLPQYRGEDKDGNGFWITASVNHVLDPIGELADVAPDPTAPPQTVTLEGAEFAFPAVKVTKLDGWHLNLRLLDGSENPQPDFTVTPKHQRRIWA